MAHDTDERATIAEVRDASRRMIRELGMLGAAHGTLGVTNSQVHAMIELERAAALGVYDLAGMLRLDKSSTSRLIAQLEVHGLVRLSPVPGDGRRKAVILTAAGRKKLTQVDREADARVAEALHTLTSDERRTVAAGLRLYARALARRGDES